jgi:hypothetical protein
MTLKSSAVVLRQIVHDCNYQFEPSRKNFSLDTQRKILSVLYVMADLKCTTLDLQEESSLDLGQEDPMVYMQLAEQMFPKVFALNGLIEKVLFELQGPNPSYDPRFEQVLSLGFAGAGSRIIYGFKKGFFGGVKEDVRVIHIPLIANIEEVLSW